MHATSFRKAEQIEFTATGRIGPSMIAKLLLEDSYLISIYNNAPAAAKHVADERAWRHKVRRNVICDWHVVTCLTVSRDTLPCRKVALPPSRRTARASTRPTSFEIGSQAAIGAHSRKPPVSNMSHGGPFHQCQLLRRWTIEDLCVRWLPKRAVPHPICL